jgi:acyl carrier protein
MYNQKDLENLIISELKEINDRLPVERKFEVNETTPLFGKRSKLDSLGLVNLLVGLEEKISSKYDVSITLTDESVLSPINNPLENPVTFAKHINSVLGSKDNE